MQVLIFGGRTYFQGYDKAGWKIQQRKKTVRSGAFRRKHAVVHVSAIMHILPGYRGTYILGVCTFGALQQTANFRKKWRGTYFRRGTYLRGFTVILLCFQKQKPKFANMAHMPATKCTITITHTHAHTHRHTHTHTHTHTHINTKNYWK